MRGTPSFSCFNLNKLNFKNDNLTRYERLYVDPPLLWLNPRPGCRCFQFFYWHHESRSREGRETQVFSETSRDRLPWFDWHYLADHLRRSFDDTLLGHAYRDANPDDQA